MFQRIRVSLVAVLALGVGGVALADTDATPHQIYEAAQSGHLAEAQQMIDQVLKDHPQNAKAHYIAAQLDVRIGDLSAGRQQLATAKQLDPSQSFAEAPALSSLERELAGMHSAPVGGGVRPFAPAVERHASVPWGLIIGLVVVGFVLWAFFRSRAQSGYNQGYGSGVLPPGNPGMQPGYGPGYSPYPPPAGGGSGLMGNLASGLAIGAGVAAGEELVRHVIDGNGNVVPAPSADYRDPPQSQDNMGGNDFGTQDGGSWGNDSGGGGDSGGDWGGGDSGGGGGDWT